MFIEVKDLNSVFHIPEPWYIDHCIFDENQKQLDVFIKYRKEATARCSGCHEEGQPLYDIADYDRVWRHMNFAEYPIYFHVEHPRTKCKQCHRILRLEAPWSVKPGSAFTMMFDAWIMTMAKDMPMNAIARIAGEHDTRLWRILHYYVDNAIAVQDLSHVTKISTDETSAKRGHNYITIFMDPEKRNVICVTKGKDSSTWGVCKTRLEEHGGDADKVTEVCMDMSPAFIKGATDNFPKASITFDKFHVIKVVNEAVDEVRRTESKSCEELKHTRYIWLKNITNLTAGQKETLDKLKDCELDTMKAYRMRIILQEAFKYPATIGPDVLKDWIGWGLRCQLKPMVEAAKTLYKHFDGITRWFSSQLNNGILEGINSLFQAAKRKARGYRSDKNLIAMVYLLAGKLNFSLK